MQMHTQVADLEQEKGELTMEIEALKKTLETTRSDLTSASGQFKIAKSQIDMLNKEKGVAMRDNAASYEQFIQLESQVRHLTRSHATNYGCDQYCGCD